MKNINAPSAIAALSRQSLPVSLAPQIDWAAVQTLVKEYVEDYEMLGEDEQGRDGAYSPTQSERFLIEDAIQGLLADNEFLALLRGVPAPVPGEALTAPLPSVHKAPAAAIDAAGINTAAENANTASEPSKTRPKRPTPAQRRRLEQIGRGEISRSGNSWVMGYYHASGTATGGVTYSMMCGLQEAGWIMDELVEGSRYKIILTDAGRQALAPIRS